VLEVSPSELLRGAARSERRSIMQIPVVRESRLRRIIPGLRRSDDFAKGREEAYPAVRNAFRQAPQKPAQRSALTPPSA
jgi:hypothetical protein